MHGSPTSNTKQGETWLLVPLPPLRESTWVVERARRAVWVEAVVVWWWRRLCCGASGGGGDSQERWPLGWCCTLTPATAAAAAAAAATPGLVVWPCGTVYVAVCVACWWMTPDEDVVLH